MFGDGEKRGKGPETSNCAVTETKPGNNRAHKRGRKEKKGRKKRNTAVGQEKVKKGKSRAK